MKTDLRRGVEETGWYDACCFIEKLQRRWRWGWRWWVEITRTGIVSDYGERTCGQENLKY